MKNVKVFLVGFLTLVLSLFCLVGCGKTGKYEAVSYTIAGFTKEVEEGENSYVELKGENVAVVSISVGSLNWEGEGTWEEGEDGKVSIKVGLFTYTATIDGNEMALDMGIGTINLEK